MITPVRIATIVAALSSLALVPCRSEARSTREILPARTLTCQLGHALNLDASRAQTVGEIRYEGSYRFSLFLPSIPKREGPLPQPTDEPEPVDPATRVVDDPAGLASDAHARFNRVIDLWPDRVELVAPIDERFSRLIIISEIDAANGKANLFMTRAADAGSLDLENVYQGGCWVDSRAATTRRNR